MTFNVMRDESRHVSFGQSYLTPVIAKMHPDEVEDARAVCVTTP